MGHRLVLRIVRILRLTPRASLLQAASGATGLVGATTPIPLGSLRRPLSRRHGRRRFSLPQPPPAPVSRLFSLFLPCLPPLSSSRVHASEQAQELHRIPYRAHHTAHTPYRSRSYTVYHTATYQQRGGLSSQHLEHHPASLIGKRVLLPKLVLKFHWKAKDVALSEARKNSKVLGASALQDGDSRQSVMDGQQHVMGAALGTMEAAVGTSAEAS